MVRKGIEPPRTHVNLPYRAGLVGLNHPEYLQNSPTHLVPCVVHWFEQVWKCRSIPNLCKIAQYSLFPLRYSCWRRFGSVEPLTNSCETPPQALFPSELHCTTQETRPMWESFTSDHGGSTLLKPQYYTGKKDYRVTTTCVQGGSPLPTLPEPLCYRGNKACMVNSHVFRVV